ncbi:MAG: multiple resistance and pH regulation protein F [Candidatus Omnitrophica bacterium]|nr:multiple resistance and pH regulation protein F [Candidatus Omnitrophota bacterium]MBD3269863.1 multiple resistance and pH regulation protein F [Candidatus Omnitrophota bacterium]
MNKKLRWFMGAVILGAIVAVIIFRPLPFLFYQDLPYLGFLGRSLYIIILASLLSLYRIIRGPTGADRIVALDILGIMIVGLCAVLTISTGRSWYIDIGIAWALQSFISTLALSKYLEGKGLEE